MPDDNGIVSNEEHYEDHVGPSGWYSNDVMAMAARRTFKYELDLMHQLHNNVNILSDDSECVGAVCNIQNEHWIGLKSVDWVIWKLDSQKQPAPMLQEDFLASITENIHCYPVIRL